MADGASAGPDLVQLGKPAASLEGNRGCNASPRGRNAFQFQRQGLVWKSGVRQPLAQRGVEALGLKWADLVGAGIFKVAAGLQQSPLRGGLGGCWGVCPCSLLGKMGLCAWLAE